MMIYLHKTISIILTILVIFGLCATAMAQGLTIDVVYPRPESGDTIARIDDVKMNFIFGSVSDPASRLWINEIETTVHPNGSFLAYLPVDWNAKSYRLIAITTHDKVNRILPFERKTTAHPPIKPSVTFPINIMLTGGAMRTHTRGAYYLFPDSGTVATATNWQDGHWQIPLGGGLSVWAPDARVIPLPNQPSAIPIRLTKITLREWDNSLDVIIPTGQKVLYRLSLPDDLFTLKLDLYGVTSHIDIINFPSECDFISSIGWQQPANGVVSININLKQSLWGYQPWWDDGKLVLTMRKPPQVKRNGLKDLRIAIDAGHGGSQFGAIGPSRLKEKDINLQVALELKELADKAGAITLLTRDADYDLGLNDRIILARDFGADLLISIHHNALSDGTNPFGHFGVSARFYHPFAQEFAQCLQDRVASVLQIPNEGIIYHNLAITRATAFPSVLLEAAYIMFPEQESIMIQDDYPNKLAKAILNGIADFTKSDHNQITH